MSASLKLNVHSNLHSPSFSFKKQKYKGERDPATKKRHGVGTFQYANPFFRYEGEYVMGKKHGKGKLFFGDGREYEGDFNEGEITGSGVMTWSNGQRYEGEFVKGERCGYGLLKSSSLFYDGMWKDNLYSGMGVLKDKEKGIIIDGTFEKHKGSGNCLVTTLEGDVLYQGELENGMKNGHGVSNSEGLKYKGEWVEDKKKGDGALTDTETGIMFKGSFENDLPTSIPSSQLEDWKMDELTRVIFTVLDLYMWVEGVIFLCELS